MTKINKRSGPKTVLLGSEMEPPAHRTLTTGSLSFDAALGGGWATCHWHEIIGQPSHGKTFTTLKMVAANQARDPDWIVAWVAAEDFVEEYA
jgi:RecA/RadA recombinase